MSNKVSTIHQYPVQDTQETFLPMENYGEEISKYLFKTLSEIEEVIRFMYNTSKNITAVDKCRGLSIQEHIGSMECSSSEILTLLQQSVLDTETIIDIAEYCDSYLRTYI